MERHQVIAIVLAIAAVSDLILAFFVLGPRLPEQSRITVLAAMVISAALMLTLAVAFWMQLLLKPG